MFLFIPICFCVPLCIIVCNDSQSSFGNSFINITCKPSPGYALGQAVPNKLKEEEMQSYITRVTYVIPDQASTIRYPSNWIYCITTILLPAIKHYVIYFHCWLTKSSMLKGKKSKN